LNSVAYDVVIISHDLSSHTVLTGMTKEKQRNAVPIPCLQVEVTVRIEKLTTCSAAYEVPNFYRTQI